MAKSDHCGGDSHHLIESSGLANRLEIQLNIEPLPVEPPHATKIAIYRCAQECISNIVRHSGATSLTISLTAQGPMLELRIEDNGSGFDRAMPGNGIGLQALDEHAECAGRHLRNFQRPNGYGNSDEASADGGLNGNLPSPLPWFLRTITGSSARALPRFAIPARI